MQDIVVNGISYRIGRLSALKQFHVVRRLAPLLSGFREVSGDPIDLADLSVPEAVTMLGPLTEAVAGMSDADAEYIITTCLGVVERKQTGGGYAQVVTTDHQILFDDIDMTAMLALTAHTIGGNLQGFFDSLSSVSPGGKR